MSDTIIRVENLGKKYIIDHQQEGRDRYKSLRDVIANGANSISSRFFNPPHKSITNPAREEFWALNHVSFEIQQGDRVGIIGRNGAGKSTLLKILSRITEPTNGRISIKGRVASLLEVGTGFHPELTGRENIYLNGAVLGMGKVEIKRKFDEIVDFAEVEKFLDTPVKRYSSGMYVRLAFAVAAHLEPEILIVDEVLAVGDAQFQKKCLGKMGEVSQDGRTVLFVSHNTEAIQRLCSKCVFLSRGQLVEYADTGTVMKQYLSSNNHKASAAQWIDLSNTSRTGNGKSFFRSAYYSSLNQDVAFNPYSNGPLEFLLEIESDVTRTINSLAVVISDQNGNKLVNADTLSLGDLTLLKKGGNTVKLRIEELHLKPGNYLVGLWLADLLGGTIFDCIETAFEINITELRSESVVKSHGVVTCRFGLIPMANR